LIEFALAGDFFTVDFSLIFASEAEMKYLFSRLLMSAAVVGANMPFNLMEAMLDLPIIVIFAGQDVFVLVRSALQTFSNPIRSFCG